MDQKNNKNYKENQFAKAENENQHQDVLQPRYSELHKYRSATKKKFIY